MTLTILATLILVCVGVMCLLNGITKKSILKKKFESFRKTKKRSERVLTAKKMKHYLCLSFFLLPIVMFPIIYFLIGEKDIFINISDSSNFTLVLWIWFPLLGLIFYFMSCLAVDESFSDYLNSWVGEEVYVVDGVEITETNWIRENLSSTEKEGFTRVDYTISVSCKKGSAYWEPASARLRNYFINFEKSSIGAGRYNFSLYVKNSGMKTFKENYRFTDDGVIYNLKNHTNFYQVTGPAFYCENHGYCCDSAEITLELEYAK